jgi:soluble lytic murein transglycosylase
VVLGAAVFTLSRHQPDFVQRIRYPLRYEQIVRGHAGNYNLDPALLAAVIYTESHFDARARSNAGAIGLMQLLPETARGIAIRTGGNAFVVDDLYVPELNVRYGAWYLRNLLDRYGDERTALAAYHAGQGNVDRWRKQGIGIQFPETRSYVAKVERTKGIYASAYPDELGLR